MNVDYLLDNSQPFDQTKAQILDKVMEAMHSGNGQQIGQASVVLGKLQSDFNFWKNTHSIMINSQNSHTKFFALMILKDTVKSRWNIIEDKVKTELRSFILKIIAQIAIQNNSNDKAVLTKANELLIEIIKNEWGKTWNTAIQDLTNSAKTNQNVCFNNLKILKMLSEDIFDFSKNQMTSNQVEELKSKFEKEFTSIYELCDMIIKTFITNNKSFKIQLVKECLTTLQAFLSWMPIQYIFLTDLPELILKLMEQEYLTGDCIKCLTDIISIDFISLCGGNQKIEEKCKMKILETYNTFVEKLQKILPRTQNLKTQRNLLINGKNHNKIVMFDNSVKQFIRFFTMLFETHYSWIFNFILSSEKMHMMKLAQILNVTLYYMAIMSEIEEENIFRSSVVFWEKFLLRYAEDYPSDSKKKKKGKNNGQILNLDSGNSKKKIKELYDEFFSNQVKVVIMNSLVNQMPKPEEVKFELDESGLPKTIKIDNTSHSEHYKKTKNCLCSLAKCNFMNLRGILDHHVNEMMSFTNFNKLNKLCWAIGTISGVGTKQNEKSMIIPVLRNLLSLTQRLKKINEKSIVASNIMFIVCKYPNFLIASFEFMMCVFNKVFEFMKNQYNGVKKMAVDTFKILCEKCGERIVRKDKEPDQMTQNPGFASESWDILCDLLEKTEKLQLSHKITFYEGIGYLLGYIKDDQILTHCIQYTLTPLMTSWKSLIGNAEKNTNYLVNDETCTNISFFMRVNERMSATVKKRYFKVFDHVFKDLIVLYKFYSDQIINALKNKNENERNIFLNSYGYKRMKGVRNDILNLFTTFIDTADPEVAKMKYLQGFGQLLQSYRNEINETKEAALLLLYSKILNKMSNQVGEDAQFLLNGLFDSTLPMITKDFNSYPDHRINFFIFLKFAVKNCFQYLIKIKPVQFKILIDCLLWSIKHELSTIFVIGLKTIQILLERVCQSQQMANGFFKRHYFTLLHEIIAVLTDNLHKNGFEQQKEILRMLLGALDVISEPLSLDQKGDNKSLVALKILDLMKSNFPNLKAEDHQTCVQRLFASYQDNKNFSIALEDYLVVLNIFTNKEFNV